MQSQSSRVRRARVGAALTAALAVTGIGVVSAQTSTTTPATSSAPIANGVSGAKAAGRFHGGFGSHAATIAAALGITPEQLQTELVAGKSVAQIATARGVALQKVIDAYVAEESAEHPGVAKADIVTKVTNALNGVRPAPRVGVKDGRGVMGGKHGGGRRH